MTVTSVDLAVRFPLTVAGAQALPDLPETPGPPIPLESAELAAWKRIPLSKRRLAVLGALEAGTKAAFSTAIVIAAECRAQGIPFAVAEKIACAITFTTNTTPRRQVLRQLPRAAAFAYEPKNGEPILSGCCRDPRPRETSGLASPGRMRRLMAPYCDGTCAASCPMLRAIRFPTQAIAETEYAHIASSSLFQRSGGLGEAGRVAYEKLALAASVTPDRLVAMSATYLAQKSEGLFNHQTFSRALKALGGVGLAPPTGEVDESRTIIRLVPVLSPTEVRELETRLGVNGQRRRNVSAAQRATVRRRDWLYERLTDAEKIDAWIP
jgi:hypothetical protein